MGFGDEEVNWRVPKSEKGGHPVLKIPDFFGMLAGEKPKAITVALDHGTETLTTSGRKDVAKLFSELGITSEAIVERYKKQGPSFASAGADSTGSTAVSAPSEKEVSALAVIGRFTKMVLDKKAAKAATMDALRS